MQIIEYDNPLLFRDKTIEFLLQREAERCVELGIVGRLVAGMTTSAIGDELARPRLWTVEDGDNLVAVAIQTLADTMIVSGGSGPAMSMLARHLKDKNWDGQYLVGSAPAIGELVNEYASLSRRQQKLELRCWTMEVREVVDPMPVPGSIHECGQADFDLLKQWTAAFSRAIGEEDDGARMAGNLLKDRRVFFWIDGGPRAMAAWAGPTPNGIRINFVYTPPEFRRRGYASNLVAQLSRQLLAQGRKFCFLNADQANPTSNHIYESIGYVRVSTFEKWGLAG
jgi:uncharacterized protein